MRLLGLVTYLNINFFEELHLHFVSFVVGAADTFEVELCALHLDDGVLDVRETDGEDDVFWSLSPHTAGRANSEEIFVTKTKTID